MRVKEAGMMRQAFDVPLESTAKVASAAGALIEKKGSIFKLTPAARALYSRGSTWMATWTVPSHRRVYSASFAKCMHVN